MKSTNVNENGYAFQQEFFCETLVSPAVVSDAMCALIGPRGKPKSIESMFKTSGTASKKWCSGESGKTSSAVAKRLLDAPCHLKIMLIQILVCMVVRNARFLCDSRAFCQSYKRVRQMSCRRLCVYPLIQRQSVEGVVNCSITLYIV